MGVGLAFCSALLLGAADFCGGLASKRARVLAVVVWSNTTGGLLALLLAVVIGGGSPWSLVDIGWGAAAGVAGSVGAVLLYRALASGVMSVVAPTTAAVAAAVPVLVGLVAGDRLSAAGGVGIAAGLLAVWFVSRTSENREDASVKATNTASSLLLSLLAGAGFGLFFVFLSFTDRDSSLWPLVWARVASVALLTVLVLARGISPRLRRLPARQAVLSGVLDMSSSALYVVAIRNGDLAVIGLLASLYPVSTVLLARLLLSERVSRIQGVGIALATASVVLLSV